MGGFAIKSEKLMHDMHWDTSRAGNISQLTDNKTWAVEISRGSDHVTIIGAENDIRHFYVKVLEVSWQWNHQKQKILCIGWNAESSTITKD